MRHVSDWTLDDGSLLLNFSDEVLGMFERHIQVGDLPESGGVLLGTVHEKGLLVTLATTAGGTGNSTQGSSPCSSTSAVGDAGHRGRRNICW